MNSTTNVTDQLNYTFNELDAAVKYTVTVITLSEKSKLESDPAERSVYTTPSAVYNLKVMKVTNESVELSWNHSGRYDFYSVHVSDVSKLRNTTERTIVISGLTPGKMYNFTVTAIVNSTTKSVPKSVSTYTKPSRVLNLKSADNNERLIHASWTKPDETLSGYRVCLNENNTFCNKCNDFNDCSECVNCTNTTSTAAWVNFPGKTPGTKYILCVAALTNNNETQGEMVQIDAYTRPSKVANLSLTSTSQSINVSWELIEGYKEFNVSIKADGRIQTFNVTDQSSYFFDKLQAAVNYTITVITLSEKPKLESDPVEQSLHTKPVSPVWATATVLNHTAINVIWGVPTELTGNSTITYKVTAHSHRNTPNESCVTQNNFIFNKLKPGTNYSFNVSVMAGKEASDPKTAYGMTVPNKKKVTFVLMCTSETSLYCSKNTTLAEIKEELEKKFGNNYKNVYWKLKKIDEK
nr:receptor-type tyrosine-protein phosphatase eta-like isoform X1 [Misgurnus anguillicaudatus]